MAKTPSLCPHGVNPNPKSDTRPPLLVLRGRSRNGCRQLDGRSLNAGKREACPPVALEKLGRQQGSVIVKLIFSFVDAYLVGCAAAGCFTLTIVWRTSARASFIRSLWPYPPLCSALSHTHTHTHTSALFGRLCSIVQSPAPPPAQDKSTRPLAPALFQRCF